MKPDDVARAWEANAETWTRHARRGLDVYRDALNTPAFLAMLPPVDGLIGLDIGCGEGSNTRQLARRGARMHAVDIAPTFIRHARERESADRLGITFTVGDGMALPFRDGSFDFAAAFMSLMDMPDPGQALRDAARVLRPGGFLQFSILHPCFMPPHRKVLRDDEGTARGVELANYFDRIDGREDTWWFSTLPEAEREEAQPFRTPRFHRTLSAWIAMIVGTGLVIEAMSEPRADPELARTVPVVADTAVVPLFLHVRARKPPAAPSISLDHVQLAMPPGREAEARAFYAGLLGLLEVAKPPNLAARGGCWFAGGAAKLHLGVERDFVPARKAHPALLIPNLAELVSRVEAAGSVCRADEPLDGYDRRYVDDPFGNRIELMQVAPHTSGAAAASIDDVETIKAGELRLLEAGTRASASEVAILLHDDFVEFGSSGRVFDKAATVSGLAAERNNVRRIVREAGDFTFRRLGPDAILVTYRVSRHTPDLAEKKSLRSSVWVRAEAGWRLLFHQGTASAERSVEE